MEKQVEKKEDKPQQEVKKIDPYKVYGSDFSITNQDYIDFYKTRFKIMAIRYKLVGRVNNKGIYVIPNEIKNDLVKMSKEIEDMGDDYYTASNVYMKKYFYFRVKLTMLEDGKAKASLFLLEYVENFLDKEYITTHIADFVDIYNDQYRIKLRKAFNLVDVAVPMNDLEVPNLAVIMQDNLDIGFFVNGLYDIASQIYLMRMLKILESAGEKGQAILNRYKQLVLSLDDIDKEKFKNTLLKSLLDRVIDEFGGLEKLDVDKALVGQAVKEMNSSIKAIDGAQKKPGAIEAIAPKGDAKKDAKKSASKKKDSKKKDSKKSGGDKKKDDKKKDDKKKSKGNDNWLMEIASDIDIDEIKSIIKEVKEKSSSKEKTTETSSEKPKELPKTSSKEVKIEIEEKEEINLDDLDDDMLALEEEKNEGEINIEETPNTENFSKEKEINVERDLLAEEVHKEIAEGEDSIERDHIEEEHEENLDQEKIEEEKEEISLDDLFFDELSR